MLACCVGTYGHCPKFLHASRARALWSVRRKDDVPKEEPPRVLNQPGHQPTQSRLPRRQHTHTYTHTQLQNAFHVEGPGQSFLEPAPLFSINSHRVCFPRGEGGNEQDVQTVVLHQPVSHVHRLKFWRKKKSQKGGYLRRANKQCCLSCVRRG